MTTISICNTQDSTQNTSYHLLQWVLVPSRLSSMPWTSEMAGCSTKEEDHPTRTSFGDQANSKVHIVKSPTHEET